MHTMSQLITFLALGIPLLLIHTSIHSSPSVALDAGATDHCRYHEYAVADSLGPRRSSAGESFRRSALSLNLPPGIDTLQHVLQLICSHTLYPGPCLAELSSFQLVDLLSLNPVDLVSYSIQAAANRADEALDLASRLASAGGRNDLEDQSAGDCVDLMSDAKDELDAVVSKLSSMQGISSIDSLRSSLQDVKAWMSSAMSYQAACSDGFELVPGSATWSQMQSNQEYLAQVMGNGFTLVDALAQVGGDLGTWISGNLPPVSPPYVHVRGRRLLSSVGRGSADSLPRWVGAAERKLLQSSPSGWTPDAVVAADGSGDYLTVASALQGIPSGGRGGSRYIIYIKAGVYEEVFNITKSMKKITFVGDGIGKTVITGSRNVASGLYNTYRTATVGVSGKGFLARDITFRNTAGPGGHQAVALRGAADLLVFYRCSFEGYQDTLYALASRQFYRECRIMGTVDFVFGNAIAVFQNCEVVARQPGGGQQNTCTAQGRKIPADVSGFSFQNCSVAAEGGQLTAPTYLGRPWKAYSRVVFMQSELGSIVEPAGWLRWNQSDPFIDTLFYGEFQNRGPGAATGGRVAWPGVHPTLTQDEASTFTVSNFIAGDTWLNNLQVQYHASLF